jgi:hypothetical protein
VEDGKRDQRSYEAHEAAAMLGMSGANLRRLAPIYERVYGELPRDVRRGRVWPDHAIDRLKRARDAVRAGQAGSVQAALVAERTGEDLSSGKADALPAPNSLAELVADIRALRRTIEDQSRLIVEQGRRLEALESGEAHEPSELPTQSAEGSTIVQRDRETLSLWRMVVGVILSAVAWAYPFWSLNTLPLGLVPGVEHLYRTMAIEAWWRLFLWVLAFALNLGFGFWYGLKKRGLSRTFGDRRKSSCGLATQTR